MKFYGKEYRKPGVPWRANEMPMLKVIPKAYVYTCELCHSDFTSDYEIHIPWCTPCRAKNINSFSAKEEYQKKLTEYPNERTYIEEDKDH